MCRTYRPDRKTRHRAMKACLVKVVGEKLTQTPHLHARRSLSLGDRRDRFSGRALSAPAHLAWRR